MDNIQEDIDKSLAKIDVLMKKIQNYKKDNNISHISHISIDSNDLYDKNYINYIVENARKLDNTKRDNTKLDNAKLDYIKKYNYICVLGISVLITSGLFLYILNQFFI
jgi:hypothetical protein